MWGQAENCPHFTFMLWNGYRDLFLNKKELPQLKKEKGYRGKYYAAAGITYGYVRPLARHLAIEFSVGIGYLDTEYRKYTSYGNDLAWVSSGKYHFIGPTKAKISLVWLLTSGR